MNFQVLGPLRALDGDAEVDLGGPKQRLVLAILLAAHGTTVTTEALVDGVWGETPPASARKTLQGYIHHLRSGIPSGLDTEKSGYSFTAHDDLVDDRRFTTAFETSRPLLSSDPRAASAMLASALALWRGSPYADLDGAPVLLAEITRLREARVVALGDRIEADLAVGRHEMLVGELESLVIDYPLHERFRRQHMLALYRCGRHGEALRVFSRARKEFVDEMGIDPSEQLRALERRILDRDPGLDLDADRSSGPAQAVRGYELREVVARDRRGTLYRGYQRSVGREVAIRVTGPDVADDPDFIARYESDVARVAQLDHPRIAYVHDMWREPGHAYQVMRWIDGERLDSYLSTHRLDGDEALDVLDRLADTLEFAHRADVVHGDLDAHAVVRAGNGDVYLTDFVAGRRPGTASGDRTAFVHLSFHVLFGVPIAPGIDPLVALESVVTAPTTADVLRQAFADAGAEAPSALVEALRRSLGFDVARPTGGMSVGSPRSDKRCPYKGLHAFQVADAADFHGRDDLVARLHRAVTSRRLVAVVGPSGSGKSSLVKAGLVPLLRCGNGRTFVAEMFPGSDPFDALARAVRSVAVEDSVTSEALLADPRGLTRTLVAVLPGDTDELVLVIDQFEELFTAVHSEAVRALLLDSITCAVNDPASRLRVVLTMRADFFDRPLRYADFGGLVEAGLVPVVMPDHDGLRAAIERPAAAVGVRIEPGLTTEMLHDVDGEPGGLPLLQYALTELFEHRESDVLTVDEYHAAGGVLGALATRAEGVFAGLQPSVQTVVRQAFLRMVAVNERGTHVRRRVTRAELHALEVGDVELEEGLRRFGAHRLLTFDADLVSRAPTVEVAHESLLTEWSRLRRWIDDQREELVVRRRLDAAVAEWDSSGEDDGYLLTGRRLAEFDSWAVSTKIALSGDERAFLQASREHDDQLERSASSRRRRVLASLGVAATLATMFGIVALIQRNDASHSAYRSETARLASQAGFVMDDDRQTALLMAAEAYRRDPGADGLGALLKVGVGTGPYLGHLGAGNAYRDVRWLTPDDVLAVGEGVVHLLDVENGAMTILPIDSGPVSGGTETAVAASPGGLAAVATANEQVLLVDAGGATVAPFPSADGSTALDISPDGSTVAVGHADGTLDLVERESGEVIDTIVAHPVRATSDIDLPRGTTWDPSTGDDVGGVDIVEFVDDERLLTGGDAYVRLWNVDGLSPVGPEILHAYGDDEFNLVASTPRAVWVRSDTPDTIVTAGRRHLAQWDATSGERLALDVLPTTLADAARGAGDEVVMLLTEGQLVVRDLDDLAPRGGALVIGAHLVVDIQERDAHHLDVSDDGSRAAVATADGVVLVALDGDLLLADAVSIGVSTSPSLSADGTMLAPGFATDGLLDLATDPPTAGTFDVQSEAAGFGDATTFEIARAGDADALIWTNGLTKQRNAYDLATGDYLADVWGEFVPAWSDDGRRLARARRRGGTLISARDGDLDGYETSRTMTSGDFEGSGERVTLTFDDGSAAVIDLRSGSEVALTAMPGGVVSAAFTPDDARIVTIGGDGSVWAIDPTTGERVDELDDAGAATGGRIGPPRFSPDGTLMFSAADGVARLWHLPSGRRLGALPSDPGYTPSANEGDDVLRVVSPVDGRALIWDLDIDRWVDLACAAAGRDMTASEWAAHGPRDTDHRPTCAANKEGP